MKRYVHCLTIAGSDCSGGAGIQADLKTMSALGVYGMSVITAVTAQNTCGVRSIQPISASIVRDQLEAIAEDIEIDAVKIGMLFNTEIITEVARFLRKYKPGKVVLDPVMIATSKDALIEKHADKTILEELIGLTTLLTPNRDETESLSGIPLHTKQDISTAANRLLDLGAEAVLIKGGHLCENTASDYLFRPHNEPRCFSSTRIETSNTHGTGCTLSAAIAAYLALGKSLEEAIGLAKNYLTNALIAGSEITTGHGHGPLNHLYQPLKLSFIHYPSFIHENFI